MAPNTRTEPPPDHLISPLEGQLTPKLVDGLYLLCVPIYRRFWQGWEDQHVRAEEQTLGMRSDGMPVADLYIDGAHLTLEMGWCVDA